MKTARPCPNSVLLAVLSSDSVLAQLTLATQYRLCVKVMSRKQQQKKKLLLAVQTVNYRLVQIDFTRKRA